MKGKIKMSGYDWANGMSNNAVSAYADGEKPLSKWSKKDILEKIQEVYPDIYELSKKQTVATLKKIFLYKSSWHHTSKFYNITDFYSFDEDLEIEDITGAFIKAKEKEKELYCLNIRIPKTDSYNAYLNLTQTQLKRLKKEKTNDMTYYRIHTMNEWQTWFAPSYKKANVKLNIYDFKKEIA